MKFINMWYETEESAQKACSAKEKEFGEEFVVLKESTKLGKDAFPTDIYWAQRKSALKRNIKHEIWTSKKGKTFALEYVD